jgi:hypothetical protein
MPGAGRDRALRVESDGQGIADALDPRCVITRGAQGLDCEFANRLQSGTRLAEETTPVRATNPVAHGFRDRSVIDLLGSAA